MVLTWQADALEHALMAALPLGPQSAAGGVTLPESFRGELQVQSVRMTDISLPSLIMVHDDVIRHVMGTAYYAAAVDPHIYDSAYFSAFN